MSFFSRYALKDVIYAIHYQSGVLMGALQDAVDQITAQLAKAQAEIVAKIADLEAQIAAGETPDLGPLKAAAQALDDVVEDTVVEEPPVE